MVRKFSRKGGKTFRRITLKKGGTKRKFQKGGMWRNKQCSALVGFPWNPRHGGNHFSLGTPIGVGGSAPFLGNNSISPQTTFSAAKSLSQRGGKYKKHSRKSHKKRSKSKKRGGHCSRYCGDHKGGKKSRRKNRKMRGGAVTGQSSKDSSHDSAPADHKSPKNTKCLQVDPNINPPNPDSLLPQPLVNAYRVAKNSIFNAYNTYQGLPQQSSPLPHIQNSMQL
jgi:hypothetical protein